MSGIAGVFNRLGEPVDPRALERATLAAVHRGPDGRGSWIEGQVGFSQLLLATTPEAVEETHPLLDPERGTCIVFDGRVDNREELARVLESHGIGRRGPTDMELVLKAYELWGEECAPKILGDFAFVVWDALKRRLYCARDITGVRPFYYFLSHRHFFFGSEIRQVLAHHEVAREVNEGMVCEFLVFEIGSQDETLYRDVLRLEPAHSLVVEPRATVKRRYWDVRNVGRLNCRRVEDYAERFLGTLRESTAARLRCKGEIGITLSGGLDSSLVAGIAQSLLNGRPGSGVLTGYSTTFPGRDVDESEWIEAVAEKWRLKRVASPFTGFAEEPAWEEQARRELDLPDDPVATTYRALQRRVPDRVRVLLTGSGAARSFEGNLYPYLGQLRRCDLIRFGQTFRTEVGARGVKRTCTLLARSLIWPLLPVWARHRLESSVPRNLPPQVEPELLRRSHFADRRWKHCRAHQFRDLGDWQAAAFIDSGLAQWSWEVQDRIDAVEGIEQRHPFMDRRMIELGYATPVAIHRADGKGKALLRMVGRDLIPQVVLDSNHFAHFTCCYTQMFRFPIVSRVLSSLEIAELGWVSQKRVNDAIRTTLARSTGLESGSLGAAMRHRTPSLMTGSGLETATLRPTPAQLVATCCATPASPISRCCNRAGLCW